MIKPSGCSSRRTLPISLPAFPKITSFSKMAKNGKAKSSRKPLKDISNSRNSSKSVKKISSDKDTSLDRLFVAHSDLSNLIRQIDKLVSEKIGRISKLGSQEIDSFTYLLSDMHLSLKAWLPRFQEVLPSSSTPSQNQIERKNVSAQTKEEKDIGNCANEDDFESLMISPSPLVSWPASCNFESGRQLFLLTPLPKSKVRSSKRPGFPRQQSERVSDMGPPRSLSLPQAPISSTTSHSYRSERVLLADSTPQNSSKYAATTTYSTVPFEFASSKITNQKQVLAAEATPQNNSKSAHTKTGSTLEFGFASSQFYNQIMDHSTYHVAPVQIMSPPKASSLQPISESLQQDCNGIPAMVYPCPTGIQKCEGSPTLENTSILLAGKYPDLFGLVPGTVRSKLESSLDWFLSPPKTCVLMEPPKVTLPFNHSDNNEGSGAKLVIGNQSTDPVSVQNNSAHCTKQSLTPDVSERFGYPESTPMWNCYNTPMWKELENTGIGKQCGENTLKRELWTKFEAVSTNGLHYVSVSEDMDTKGFLDRLEEVSREEMVPKREGLR